MSYRVYSYTLSGGGSIDWVPGVPLAAWGGPGRRAHWPVEHEGLQVCRAAGEGEELGEDYKAPSGPAAPSENTRSNTYYM